MPMPLPYAYCRSKSSRDGESETVAPLETSAAIIFVSSSRGRLQSSRSHRQVHQTVEADYGFNRAAQFKTTVMDEGLSAETLTRNR